MLCTFSSNARAARAAAPHRLRLATVAGLRWPQYCETPGEGGDATHVTRHGEHTARPEFAGFISGSLYRALPSPPTSIAEEEDEGPVVEEDLSEKSEGFFEAIECRSEEYAKLAVGNGLASKKGCSTELDFGESESGTKVANDNTFTA